MDMSEIRPRLTGYEADEIVEALKLRKAIHRAVGNDPKATLLERMIIRFEKRKPGRPQY